MALAAIPAIVCLLLAGCGGATAELPPGPSDVVLQSLVGAGSLYRSYRLSWVETSETKAQMRFFHSLQASFPAHGCVYLIELGGDFTRRPLGPSGPVTGSGEYLTIFLPAVQPTLGSFLSAVGVVKSALSFQGLGPVHHAWFKGLRQEGPGRTPDLVGLLLPEAKAQLHELGLALTLAQVETRSVPFGSILAQRPAPGTRVIRRWRVRLSVAVPPTG